MRRPVLQYVSAVGVLAALAAIDLGPRAAAAYLSMARVVGPAGLDAAALAGDVPGLPLEPGPDRGRDERPAPVVHLQGGSAAPPLSSGSSSGPPPVGDLPRAEPPAGELVAYFREPTAPLDLAAFVPSILDPPRQA